MDLTLSPEEGALLQNILERHLSRLREEIGKTEKYSFRQELKADEAMLKALMARLERVVTA